jgi:hypothetical protein
MIGKLLRRFVLAQCLAALSIYLDNSPLKAEDSLSVLGRSADNVQETSAIWHLLSQRTDLSVADVLLSMKGQSDMAKNWYLALAQKLADRNPVSAAEDCLLLIERSQEDPTARFWAFLYLTEQQAESRERLLESMLEDSSPPLRYEAIKLRLNRLESATGESTETHRAEYENLLNVARLPSQVQEIAVKLRNSGREVDLLRHFGFVDRWLTTGPFDNKDQSGFNQVYGPEADYLEGNLLMDEGRFGEVKYPGIHGDVGWKVLTTTEQDGSVDLSEPYEKEKGALVYALANFTFPQELEAEVRVGSQNAVKVWVNGQLAISREVYHAGAQIDQYRGGVRLHAGENSVLVKICQNEQTESWAQSWFFQLRFSDSSGRAVRID